jgi:hypothetical protein
MAHSWPNRHGAISDFALSLVTAGRFFASGILRNGMVPFMMMNDEIDMWYLGMKREYFF